VKAARLFKWTLVGLIALQCSNPVDKDIRWKTSVDLPVTANKKFPLGAWMDTLFFNKQAIITKKDTIHRAGKPDTVVLDTTMQLLKAYPLKDSLNQPIPDTVQFAFPAHDSASDTISEDSFGDKTYDDAVGPIPLSSAAATTITLPVPALPYVGGTAVTLPAVSSSIKDVGHIQFSTGTQNLPITLTNNTSAAFTGIQIAITGLGTWVYANVAAGASATTTVNVAGKSIDSTAQVTITYTTQGSGTFAAGGSLGLSFSLDKLTADVVSVKYALLSGFKRSFVNNYKLTDTVDVNYIDILDGHFSYIVTNHSGADIKVAINHRHLWQASYCARNNYKTVNDLAVITDSSKFDGYVSGPIDFPAGVTSKVSHLQNISADRLFGVWTGDSSVTQVEYIVTIAPPASGGYVTIKAGDNLHFVIQAPDFKFREMVGKSMEIFRRDSKPTSYPVALPWGNSVKDSLKNHFKLQKIVIYPQTRFMIPEGAYIDTINMLYHIASLPNTGTFLDSSIVLTHVSRDSVYKRPINITRIVNDFPDSVQITVSMIIPKNTYIAAVNDLNDATDSLYQKYLGRMIVKGKVDYFLSAPLCWTVLDTTVIDLGGNTVDLGSSLDIAKKMVKRHASLTAQITNYTNINMKLYGLMATDSTDTNRVSQLVDSTNPNYISTNRFTQLLNNPEPGFVNVLGNGVLIPPRDSITKVTSTVSFSENDINQIVEAKKHGCRWQIRFLPQKQPGAIVPDALSNTDWIKMNTWIHIDGINSIDSLFSGN
jgi:hypothetical protein